MDELIDFSWSRRQASFDDLKTLVTSPDKMNSYIGDANLDGEFSSADLVKVFQAGLFESGADATWEQGDFNGDSKFTSSDFVVAFQDGGFELGPRVAAPVPEPNGILLISFGVLALIRSLRRQP